MTVIVNLVKRNLKLFFRDRISVFFSLLAVLIIIGIYVLFLGNMMTSDLEDLVGSNASFIVDTWVMAGILSVVSLTTTMGAFHTMIEDKTKKISDDFFSSPIKRGHIVGGYYISSYIVGVIMSIAALIIAEIYIIANGGKLIEMTALIKLLGVMLISVFTGSSIVFFIVSFFKRSAAFSTASTIIGTLIGFLTGIYIPIGSFPSSIQTVIKIFPVSHAASLYRQIMMEAPMSESFANAPAEAVSGFKESLGVVFYFGGKGLTPLTNILVLIATGAFFLIISIVITSIKKKQ
jgi:multidrug/hemolysin transport system permease protein